jgi:hypothetical protein
MQVQQQAVAHQTQMQVQPQQQAVAHQTQM